MTDRKRGGTTPWLQAAKPSAAKPKDSADGAREGSADPPGRPPAASEHELLVEADPARGRDAHARTGPVTGPDPLVEDDFDSPIGVFDLPEDAETSRVEIGTPSGPHEEAFEAETLGRAADSDPDRGIVGQALGGLGKALDGKTQESLPSIPRDAVAPPPEAELGPGEPLGPTYRVVEKLGEGGMGTIYAVEHVRMRKMFAAKVLKSALCTPDNIKRMEREATASSRIDHPCVVRVVNLDEDQEGRLFLISELLEGRDLSVRMKEGPIPPAEAISIAIQVAAGLGAAHESGVIHRDLKPENIFMCRFDGPGPVPVKVLDFGISSMLFEGDMERLTAVGSLIGTPRYMSPEHASRNPVDARSDVYSFGVLLFEMLTGAVPFEHPKPMQVILMHLRDLPPPPSAQNKAVPAAFDRVVLKCLAKDPAARYPSMDAVADDLQAIADASGWAVPLIRTSVPTSEVRGATPTPSVAPMPAKRVATEQNPPMPKSDRPPEAGSSWAIRAAVLLLLAALAAVVVASTIGGGDRAVGEPPAERRVIEPKQKLPAAPADSPESTGGGDIEHDHRSGQP